MTARPIRTAWTNLARHLRFLVPALGLEPAPLEPSPEARTVAIAAMAVLAVVDDHPFVVASCKDRVGLWASLAGDRTDDPPRVVLAGMLASKRAGEVVANPIGLTYAATVIERLGKTKGLAALERDVADVEAVLSARWGAVKQIAWLLDTPRGRLDADAIRAIVVDPNGSPSCTVDVK